MRFYSRSDVGRHRLNNQDTVLTCPDLGLWAVADGMGGHAGGERASRIACESLRDCVASGQGLRDAFLHAHQSVCDQQHRDESLASMGTTLVAVHEQDQHFELAWVGDSRLYRSSASEKLACLTRDQNVPQMLLEAGWIKPEDVDHHPRGHELTDCIGQPDPSGPRVEIRNFDWQSGDRLLLCSDGLNREVGDDRIAALLSPSHSPKQASDQLIEAALASGGRDNISVVVLDAPENR